MNIWKMWLDMLLKYEKFMMTNKEVDMLRCLHNHVAQLHHHQLI